MDEAIRKACFAYNLTLETLNKTQIKHKQSINELQKFLKLIKKIHPPRSMTAGVGWGGRDVCQSSTTIKKSDEKKGE